MDLCLGAICAEHTEKDPEQQPDLKAGVIRRWGPCGTQSGVARLYKAHHGKHAGIASSKGCFFFGRKLKARQSSRRVGFHRHGKGWVKNGFFQHGPRVLAQKTLPLIGASLALRSRFYHKARCIFALGS